MLFVNFGSNYFKGIFINFKSSKIMKFKIFNLELDLNEKVRKCLFSLVFFIIILDFYNFLLMIMFLMRCIYVIFYLMIMDDFVLNFVYYSVSFYIFNGKWLKLNV